MGSSPSFHAARACNKHREGQFDAGEQANPTREPSRASPRRETAIEALTVLSTRALAMEGAWGVTAGCSDAPSPGARLPSIPGTWRQGGEVSGGGESPKRRGGECAISTQNPPCRGNHSSRTVEAPSAPVLEQSEGEEAGSGPRKNRSRRRSSWQLNIPNMGYFT